MDSKVALTAMGWPVCGFRATMQRGHALGRERNLRAFLRLAMVVVDLVGGSYDGAAVCYALLD